MSSPAGAHPALRHQWDYGALGARGSRHRTCKRCRVSQRSPVDGEFAWASGSWLEWQSPGQRQWSPGRGPGCQDMTLRPREAEWRRVEDEHPRWEISNPAGDGKDHLCTDALIRTYGRRHTERLLAGLPPLPERAWEAERR